jgi:cobalt-zinc-cadmium efflux system membrane fusion protein
MPNKTWILVFAVFFMLSACGGKTTDDHEHKEGEKHDQKKEGGEKQKKQNTKEEHSEEKQNVKLSPEALKNAGIKVEPVKTGALAASVTVTANISHDQDRLFHVTPRIAGRAVEVRASVGSEVKMGSVLAVLDSTELGQTKAEYLKAQTLLELAKANYEREKSLFDQKISAKKDVLTAEAEYRKAEAEARTLHERLRFYGLSEQTINSRADSPSLYSLVSPGNGVVIERDLTKGEAAEPGKKVFTVADLSTVWIVLNIYERDLAKINKGASVRITTESYPGEIFAGKVSYLGDVVNPESRTLPVRVEIANPRRRLKPGMFATVEVITGTSSTVAIMIPSSAVQKVEGKPAVFVQEKDGSFAKRDIELGQEFGGSVEVKSGLKEGEQVVVTGAFTLKAELLKEGLEGHAH